MKFFSISLLCLALAACAPAPSARAQASPDKYRVADNSDIRTAIPVHDRFLFDDFKKGTVYFRNGSRSEARLNYSYFHSELQFIDSKNDTLLLAENDFVSRIVIDDMMFYYLPEQGHIQQIADFNKIRLGKRQKLLISDTQSRNAQGRYSPTVSGTTVTSYSDETGKRHQLNSGVSVILRKATTYFWMDRNERYYSASRNNLMKIFPQNRNEISTYLKDKKVDFRNEQEIFALLDFCKTF